MEQVTAVSPLLRGCGFHRESSIRAEGGGLGWSPKAPGPRHSPTGVCCCCFVSVSLEAMRSWLGTADREPFSFSFK